ncbi:hypothetical protein Tco_0144650 [Tanacetum coccineum]
MSVLRDDQMNSVINCITAKSTRDDLILYHEGPFDVKESRVMDLKLCYNTFKFKKGETPTQTFTRYKDLMNELVNDGIKISKLEINSGIINGLPKKWLSFCQSLRNTNDVKDSRACFSICPDDKEDTRSSSAVQKQLTKLNATNVARRVILQEAVGQKLQFLHIKPFQPKLLSSSQHKPELRPTKDFKSKYNKVKAKLALLSSSASAFKASMVKNKGLIAEAYEWDEE